MPQENSASVEVAHNASVAKTEDMIRAEKLGFPTITGLPADFEKPVWPPAFSLHDDDWKIFVGAEVRLIWGSFDSYQKAAICHMAIDAMKRVKAADRNNPNNHPAAAGTVNWRG